MKYKKTSIPNPSLGVDYSKEVDQVVPDQSMSLQEILARFTRGEPVPVGHETSEGIQEHDLEKLKHADLVDKAEYKEKLEEIKTKYEKQEAAKAKKQKQKEAEELEAQIIAKHEAKLKAQSGKDEPA